MNKLTQFLVDGILNEEYKEVVALFGGGFKPPTKGHLEVIIQGLKLAPEINNLKIIVGGGTRDGITQKQSKEIWEVYDDANLLPIKNVDIIEANPFTYYKEYLKSHPDDKVYVLVGSRDDNEGDKFDVKQRSEFISKYSNNVIPIEVSTGGSVSGTEARKLLKTDLDGFKNMLPPSLTQGEVNKIVDILNGKSVDTTPNPTSTRTEPLTPKEENIDPAAQKKHKGKSAPFGSAYEPLNENATYSNAIDYKQQIKDLTKHMLKKGMNILPLPRVIFKHGDQENASQFLGKTAYYSPSDMTIVLYTEGRHPKDIVRSFSHEMIHHIQNIEDRLENISTTNTMEDDNLNDIEREAYTKGNMTFRNWTDSIDGEEVTSLNEKIVGDKIECDNCDWSWDISSGGDDLYVCHKCWHDNTPQLTEGKYDSLVTKLAGFTLNAWKADLEDNQKEGYFSLRVGPNQEFDYPHLDFNYEAKATFTDRFESKGLARSGGKIPEVKLDYLLDVGELPRMWEQISMDIRNTIRHEVEHLMQGGLNVKQGKEMKDDYSERDELKSGKKPWWKVWRKALGTSDYYRLEKEIDANLQGLYLKAKKSKTPLESVIDNYLKYDLNLSLEDQEDIKDLWRKRAPKLNIPLKENNDPFGLNKHIKEIFKK